MHFVSDRNKQLMKVLIIASSLIPIYVIYMAIFSAPLQVSIFTSIYSIMMVIIWILFYNNFFDGKQTIQKSNGNLNLNNEESISKL
ncbi:MAG TPA: hypothetical protein VMX55_03895 [candidate division Zixibacteria bacterium]|nr:hypothetical protein [candidate division Zixibacteria bacterium]